MSKVIKRVKINIPDCGMNASAGMENMQLRVGRRKLSIK